MGKRVLLFITILIFISFKSAAAVFTVTSNADSGPGTLREALTLAAANGINTKDYIYFNLPGTTLADKTIPLKTQLPDVTSNLVIDGTSNPGASFGVSDAKIRITFKYVYPDNLATFYGDGCDQVEIYGIWMYNDMVGWGGSAFLFKNFGTLHIGAPSKGNIIQWGNMGFRVGEELYFQNNFCWVDETGLIPMGGDITISDCKKLTFGGSEASGNVLAGSTNILYSAPISHTLDLSFNKMGTDYTGKAAPWGFDLEGTRLNIEGYNPDLTPSQEISLTATIKNNVIADVYNNNLLRINELSGKITIQTNGFNTDLTGTINLNEYSHGGAGTGINFRGKADVLVGGDDPLQKNFIAYCSQGVAYTSSSPAPNFIVSKNSIFCFWDRALVPYDTPGVPDVAINNVNNNSISGTSTPGAQIELFNADCSCSLPGPKYYFATVKADNNGKWGYNGAVNGYIMASATNNKLTSKFVGTSVDESKVVVTNITCTTKGSITGLKSSYTTGISWYNEKNKLVGNSIDLKDVPAGKYTLKINAGTPCETVKQYEILDQTMIIDLSKLNIKPASCGSSTGYIWGIKVNVPAILTWHGQNLSGTVYGTEVSNIPAGTYTFTFTPLDGSCPQTISPLVVKSVDGPNIDQSHPDIQSANCGQSTGSIKNIIVTGTGTIKYSWLNSLNQEVATTNELTGQPAGIYILKVTDDSQCGQVFSSEINIPEINGITLDETQFSKGPTTCNQNNGFIKGITAPGATQYKWINLANNSIAGTNINLINVPSGDYQLTVSNTFGCSKISPIYHIDARPTTTYPAYPSVVQNSCVGQNNGSISLSTNNLIKSLRWIEESGQTAGTSNTLTGLKPGKYYVYFTDANGCETLVSQPYVVTEIAPLQIVVNSENRTDDQCGLKTASIKEIQIIGGTPPYTYLWTNGTNQEIATSKDISGIGAGTYTLQVKDAGSCGDVTRWSYYVLNSGNIIDLPEITPLQLCAPGQAQLSVNSPQIGSSYRLYSSATSTDALDEQTSGRFKINANANSIYYISRVTGSCESSRVKAQITISLSAIDIPNAFTPNGDGKNDYWNINGAENYPQALVQIFTRSGQKIFESKGYSIPFDGTFNGKKLPGAVYYYIVNLGKSCKMLSGYLTIIR